MSLATKTVPLIVDELEVLAALVPLAGQDIIELGCGAAALARKLLSSHPVEERIICDFERIFG